MAYKATTIEELIAIMQRVQGEKTLTKFAAELDMSKQYLSNVYNRHKEPSVPARKNWASRGKPPTSGRRLLPAGRRKSELKQFPFRSIERQAAGPSQCHPRQVGLYEYQGPGCHRRLQSLPRRTRERAGR
jgi:hypothetical protein